jgi:hypothetical protein
MHNQEQPTACRSAPLLALLLWTAMEPQARADQSGFVSIADGPPFSIIRGDKRLDATKGVKLLAGDFVETQSGNFIVADFPGDALVAFGPDTRVYLLEHAEVPTFVVVRGWLKMDAQGTGTGAPHRAIALQLGAAARQGVFVLHAADRRDEIFQEAGNITLLVRDEAATRTERESKVPQFYVREDRNPVVAMPRPGAPFVEGMPVAFRDSLPKGPVGAAGIKAAEPKVIRDVTYADVADWLTIPRDWRTGFVRRFRGRLKDRAFFSAMDARLSLHPEWTLVLHPPPPPPPPSPAPPNP